MVAVDGHELGVVAGLEVLPGKIVVLGLGSVGAEHVAQYVLLAGKVPQVLVEPDGPVAGGGELVALEVEELVGGHVVREDVAVAVGLEHAGEDDAVEDQGNTMQWKTMLSLPMKCTILVSGLFQYFSQSSGRASIVLEMYPIGASNQTYSTLPSAPSTGTGIPQSRSRLTALGWRPPSSQDLHWP